MIDEQFGELVWNWTHILGLVVGFAFAVFFGQFAIENILRQLRPEGRSTGPHPASVGVVERTLFIVMFLNGGATLVGVWIAVKVAGRWKAWTDMKQEDEGGRYFNTHLAGNGLSVLYGAVGAMLAGAQDRAALCEGGIAAVVLVVASGVYYIYVRRRRPAGASKLARKLFSIRKFSPLHAQRPPPKSVPPPHPAPRPRPRARRRRR